MKAKVISCGILAAVLATAAFAQNARHSGGSTVPAARMPNAVTATPSSPSANVGHAGIAPNAGTSPSTGVSPNVNVGHDGVAPNAQDGATSVTRTRKPKPTTRPVPDLGVNPNAREFPNRTPVSF